MITKAKHFFIYFVTLALLSVGFTQSAQAAMIGTEQIAAVASAQAHRDKIAAALNRPEVISELEKQGVNADEARACVAALTDAEAASIAGKIDSLPAGGDSILGALVFIFVLLLVTDILGLTKIFPFTRAQR